MIRSLVAAVMASVAAVAARAAPFRIDVATAQAEAFQAAVALPSGDVVAAGMTGDDADGDAIVVARFSGDSMSWGTKLGGPAASTISLAATPDDGVIVVTDASPAHHREARRRRERRIGAPWKAPP